MIHGIDFSKAAADNIRETGADPREDLRALRAGEQTIDGLLAYCLDGADDNRVEGWRDYVDALEIQIA